MDLNIILVFLASIFSLSLESSNVPPPPVLTLSAIDVEVDEIQVKRTNLFPGGPIAACSDDDPSRAFIQSVSPASPCGIRCFNLLPSAGLTSGGNSSEYSLYFEANQGSLKYTSTPRYTLTIGCTDDVEKTTTQTMTVTVKPNTPPVFNPNTLNDFKTQSGTSTKPGDVIYNVVTSDIDYDAVYYTMTTNPSTPYIAIGYADGQIRATNDLKFMCTDSVQASVTAKDAYHPAIGPKNIAITINPSNKAPYANNLDAVVTVDENVGAGATVLSLGIVDQTVYPKLDIRMWSVSDAGMEQYMLDTSSTPPVLKTRINPNYERSDTRSVKLYFDVNDGYCKANKTYSLTVNIIDINEPPVYVPTSVQKIEVYEEDINFDTGLYVTDPDLNEVLTYSATGASSKLFGVDPNSGAISSLSNIDIDTNTQFKEYTVITKVTDKGGLTATATVSITVFDANDLKPYFIPNSFTFAATECTEPGTVLGSVTGRDDDSIFNNNNQVYYGGGGGKMSVMSLGSVVLTQPCIKGETFTGWATIGDEGIYPGPLQGDPATISMTCGPCPPPTPAPTPKPPATTKTTTPASTTINTTASTTVVAVKASDDSSITDLLSWLIPAAIGALIWLALTAFLIYRYCCPCRNIFSGLCKRRPKMPKAPPEPKAPIKPKKQVTPKVVPAVQPPPPPPPPKPVTPPPPPPTPPAPVPEYVHGFWKESFTDQDNETKSQTAAKPKAIENMPSEDVVPRGNAPAPANLRLGNPGLGQHVKAPASDK